MILTESYLNKIIKLRNLNYLVHGENIHVFEQLKLEKKISFDIDYKEFNGIYLINLQPSKKNQLIELIKQITMAPNYYQDKIQKKVIILLNLQNINKGMIQKIKSISENTYETTCFIIHTIRPNCLEYNMKSRFIIVSLPEHSTKDDTIDITYKHIMRLIKKPMRKQTIEEIRELCYMYYMNHVNSLGLQKYIITKLGEINTLPNMVKINILEEIVTINRLYTYSYRKPIFLEAIIYCLCKHLEHYTFHL